jgi:hypothetical protein
MSVLAGAGDSRFRRPRIPEQHRVTATQSLAVTIGQLPGLRERGTSLRLDPVWRRAPGLRLDGVAHQPR